MGSSKSDVSNEHMTSKDTIITHQKHRCWVFTQEILM